jgi:hypothetical protein
MITLQDHALLVAALSAAAREESSAGSVLKHLANTLVGLGRALEVLVGADLLTDLLTLFGRHGLLAGLAKLLDRLLVVSQILLAANENDGETLAEVKDLRNPLLLDVVKRVGGVDGEANQDDVGVGVGQGAETVVILLASRIPEGQLDVLAIDLDIGDVVLKDSGDVDLEDGELARVTKNRRQTDRCACAEIASFFPLQWKQPNLWAMRAVQEWLMPDFGCLGLSTV